MISRSVIRPIVSAALLALSVLPCALSAQVTVYQDVDYRGQSETFSQDVPDLRRTRIGNDAISSIRLDRDCRVELFGDVDYRGTSFRVSYDIPDMRRTQIGNDAVSSMRIDCGGFGGSGGSWDGEVTAYADVDFGGASESFRGDVPDLRRSRIGNDAISSLHVPRDCRVRVYADVDYRGDSYTVTDDVRDMRRFPLGNDSISSMQVDCRGGSGNGGWGGGSDYEVTVYADVDYRGTSESFRGDVYDLRSTRIGNDSISSIRIPRDCRVELFEDAEYRGRSFRASDDISDMRRTPIGNDSVSSMRIECR